MQLGDKKNCGGVVAGESAEMKLRVVSVRALSIQKGKGKKNLSSSCLDEGQKFPHEIAAYKASPVD